MTDTCIRCGEDVIDPPDVDWPLCPPCEDTRNEAAYERQCESFYGGDGPQTDTERYEQAWKAGR